jgi:tetratricopeptide (TPR) repeat protein
MQQQRKLNLQFLVILAVALLGGVGVVYVTVALAFKDRPEKHVALAEALVMQKNLLGAVEEYRLAQRLDSKNPALLVKLGDVIRQATALDADLVGKDRQVWLRALDIDSAFMPALQRLLDSWVEEAQVWQRPEIFSNIRSYAERILSIDPSDTKSLMLLNVSYIQQWMAGILTTPQEVDRAIESLMQLAKRDASDVEIPFLVTRARFQRALDYRAKGKLLESKAEFAQVRSLLDASVQASPENPRLLSRAALVYLDLIPQFRGDSDAQNDMRAKKDAALDKAMALVKSDEAMYWEVANTVASATFRGQDPAKAEKIYRDLLQLRPEDRTVRLNLAQLLGNDSSKRDEAIMLLEATPPEDNATGVWVRFRQENETRTLLLLADYRISKLLGMREGSEREEVSKRIDDGLKLIFSRSGEHPEYLKLRGKFEQARQKYVEAIKSYNRAVQVRSQMNLPHDDGLLYELARTYLALNQTGEARKILEDLVARIDERFLPARVLLTRVLLNDANLVKADPHLRYLERNVPDDPEVMRLLLTEARLRRDTTRVRELYAKLPHTGREQALDKAVAAAELGLNDEADRAFKALLSEGSDDAQVLQEVVRFYLKTNRSEEAVRLVERAIAARPDDNAIRLLRAQLQGAGQGEVDDLINQNIDEIKDEFQREMTRSRFHSNQGRDDEAIAAIGRAEKLKPESPEVWDAYFAQLAKMKQFDEAAKWMEKLVAINHDKAYGMLYRFRLAMARSDYDLAVRTGRELTQKMPEFAQSWLALGQALQYNLKFDEARDCFLRTLEKQATSAEAYRGLIESCYAGKKYEEATRYIRDARTKLPNNAYFQRVEIDHELNYGDPERVLPLVESLLQQRPDRPEAYLAAGLSYTKTAQRKMQKTPEVARQWLGKAKDVYTQALGRWPLDRQVVGRYSEVCLVLRHDDDAEKALTTYSRRPENKGKSDPLLMLAEFYNRTGRPSHAQENLLQALSIDPQSKEIRIKLVSQLAVARDYDRALKIINDAASDDPTLVRQKVEVLIAAKRLPEARALLDELVKAHPEELAYMTALVFIAMNEGKDEEAGALIQKVLTAQPENAMALYYRAQLRLRQEEPDIDLALVDLRGARRDAPDNPDIRMSLVDALLLKRDTRAAVEELEMAYQLNPANDLIRGRLADLYLALDHPRVAEAQSLISQARIQPGGMRDPMWALRSARIAKLRGEAAVALAEMENALRLSSGDPLVLREYFELLLALKEYDRVVNETATLPEQVAQTWWIHQIRALAQARLGKRDAAISEWEKGVEMADAANQGDAAVMLVQTMGSEVGVPVIMPRVLERAKNDYRWQILAANIYHAEAQFDGAADMIDRVVANLDKVRESDRARVLQQAGGLYLASRPARAEKALGVYQKLLVKTPEDLSTLNNLACILVDYITPPRSEEALGHAQKAHELMRKNGLVEPLVLDTYGWCLVKSGKVSEGMLILQDVVQRRPFPEARYHLATAYTERGFTERASKELNSALDQIAEAEKRGEAVDPLTKKKITDLQAKLAAGKDQEKSKP